jgi:hypothetical protein
MESYFKNIQACVEDFRTAFPNFPVKYPKLVQMLENPFENMKQRVNSCIEAGGGEHFEHLF